jgi:hypothetical protein
LPFFFSVERAQTDDYIYIAIDRIKNKNAATNRIHKLLEDPMASLFSQASPPPCKSPSSTPPPKRKRDQLLTPGGKSFFFVTHLFGHFLLTQDNNYIERNYKVRKHWVSKDKRNQEEEKETEYNSETPQEPVRRSTRARSKANYKVDDAMEQ